MYSWGANSHGQLSLNFSNEMCTSPRPVEELLFSPTQVKRISGGGGHVLVLLHNKTLYSCGWNSKGQLGVGGIKNEMLLREIKQHKFVTSAAGWDTSGGINEEGIMYVWGSNLWKQLGFPVDQKFVDVPTPLDIPNHEKAKEISFGLRHTCILTESNSVYLLGKSKWLEKLKLTLPIFENNFIKLETKGKVKEIVSGENHLSILYENNCIESFGHSSFLKLPDSINNIVDKVSKIKSGWTHCGYLTDKGTIFQWGSNIYGQLGREKLEMDNSIEPVKISLPCKAIDFHLGSQHGIAIGEDHQIYTWGWNEHGNCGNGTTDNLFQAERLKFFGGKKVVNAGVGAGFCYTCIDT